MLPSWQHQSCKNKVYSGARYMLPSHGTSATLFYYYGTGTSRQANPVTDRTSDITYILVRNGLSRGDIAMAHATLYCNGRHCGTGRTTERLWMMMSRYPQIARQQVTVCLSR